MGLAATGSNDFAVPDQEIGDAWVFDWTDTSTKQAVRGGDLYKMGPISLGVLAHGAFPLGVAQRALDEFAALAQSKKRPMSSVSLASQPTIQRDFAEAAAMLGAARAYVRDSFNRLYEAALADRVTVELRAGTRLASASAVHTCAEVVRRMYLLGTTDALRDGSRLQRCFRDAHAATQHALTGQVAFIDCGAVALKDPGANTKMM
jgi:alkylation response protein AidB-like acyl-CoA dehydrogenase